MPALLSIILLATAVVGLAQAAAGAAPATAPARSADRRLSVRVGADTRTCLLHLPAGGATRPVPLVIAYHGSRGNGRGMQQLTGFDALADKQGFAVAYPDGLVEPKTWNVLFGHVPDGEGILGDQIDDVAFAVALIDELTRSLGIDPDRVYACGFSAGAYMAYRLAMDLPDRIAAAGVVNGSLGIKCIDGKPTVDRVPDPRGPMSVMHICGRLDTAVKFDGGAGPKNRFLSVPDCVNLFVRRDGCDAKPRLTDDDQRRVHRSRYTGGEGGTEVELVIVDRCGHEWPREAKGLSATDALWTFFARHSRSNAATRPSSDGR